MVAYWDYFVDYLQYIGKVYLHSYMLMSFRFSHLFQLTPKKDSNDSNIPFYIHTNSSTNYDSVLKHAREVLAPEKLIRISKIIENEIWIIINFISCMEMV